MKIELANAVTMLPFVYLTICAKYKIQAIIVTCLWVSSFSYHLSTTCQRVATWTRFLFSIDVFSQALLLLTTLNMVDDKINMPKYAINCAGVFLVIVMIYFSIVGNKSMIFACICTAHILNAIIGYKYASNREAINISMILFMFIMILFVLCEIFDETYFWSIAHVILLFYIYYFWKSFELLDLKLRGPIV